MRLSAKGFVVDPDGRLLLLDCVDPARPGVRWWELPGGGVEAGEDEVDALMRELLEETGIAVGRDAVGPLQWTQESTFQHRGSRRWARCHGYVVQVPAGAANPSPDVLALTDDEQGTILDRRWWTAAELVGTADRFFPRELPAVAARVLGGERVDQDFDVWD